jgi:transcription antitermination factor NusG
MSLCSGSNTTLNGTEIAVAVFVKPTDPWFALVTRPRHEKSAAVGLRVKGLEEFLPLQRARRRWTDRVQSIDLPLFPGYVFCRFGPKEYTRVIQTPGVRAVVGFGGKPVPVAASEIDALQTALGSGCGIQPWPYLTAGDRVRLEDGPLAGVEGILLREKSQFRVVVSVELLQRSVAVEVGRESVVTLQGTNR